MYISSSLGHLGTSVKMVERKLSRITVFSKLLKLVKINFVPVINESFDQSKSNTKVGERNKKKYLLGPKYCV